MRDIFLWFFCKNKQPIWVFFEANDFGGFGEWWKFAWKVQFEVIDLKIGNGKDLELLLWEIVFDDSDILGFEFGPLETDTAFETVGS